MKTYSVKIGHMRTEIVKAESRDEAKWKAINKYAHDYPGSFYHASDVEKEHKISVKRID